MARDTERHAFGWRNSGRLRDNAVQFVSAGNLGIDEREVKVAQQHSEVALQAVTSPDPPDLTSMQIQDRPMQLNVNPAGKSDISIKPAEAEQYEFKGQAQKGDQSTDSTDSGPLSANDLACSTSRPHSTSISSVESGAEVLVFTGRNSTRNEQRPSGIVVPHRTPSLTPRLPYHSDRDKTSAQPEEHAEDKARLMSNEKPTFQNMSSLFAQSPANQNSLENVELTKAEPYSTGRPLQRRRDRRCGYRKHSKEEIDDEEALLQDYIDNMEVGKDSSDEQSSVFRGHSRFSNGAANGEEHMKFTTTKSTDKMVAKRDDDMMGWSSADLEDLNELSTTDEELANVGRVFGHRNRSGGLQYLISSKDKGPDEARWVQHENLISINAMEQIRIYEDNLKLGLDMDVGEADNSESESSSSGEEVLNDVLNDIDSENDENERIMQYAARMTDEQIARALAKQEEFGIDADELLLLDGHIDGGLEDLGDFTPFANQSPISNRTRSKRSQHKGTNRAFSSGEAFVDALDEDPYGCFDVMDFERPSLKPKANGRKSDVPFELDDLELEEQLRRSWANDRTKKATKKREREEMRQAGLLGSKARNGRTDLKIKYSDSGMDADQIRAEIKIFLMQETEALALAPMTADMRASVHRLSKALQLKSHSQGHGNQRFPVLTKTRFTTPYTVSTIDQIDALLHQRKFFPKNSASFRGARNRPSGPDAKIRRSGGGGIAVGASYMDGDVVGATAPEIGVENRGRAMLEKMGWSSGVGIGKEGNKGSLEHIKHVVKNTKAGLG